MIVISWQTNKSLAPNPTTGRGRIISLFSKQKLALFFDNTENLIGITG